MVIFDLVVRIIIANERRTTDDEKRRPIAIGHPIDLGEVINICRLAVLMKQLIQRK